MGDTKRLHLLITNDVKVIDGQNEVHFKKHCSSSGLHQVVEVNKLHNLIVDATKSDQSSSGFLNKIQENLWKMLHISVQQISGLSQPLSFNKNGLKVMVEISTSIIQLLQKAVTDEKYEVHKKRMEELKSISLVNRLHSVIMSTS